MNVLYHVGGYIITSIRKTHKVCQQRITFAGDNNGHAFYYNKLTRIRCDSRNKLFYLNMKTFNFYIDMEIILRKNINLVKKKT